MGRKEEKKENVEEQKNTAMEKLYKWKIWKRVKERIDRIWLKKKSEKARKSNRKQYPSVHSS